MLWFNPHVVLNPYDIESQMSYVVKDFLGLIQIIGSIV